MADPVARSWTSDGLTLHAWDYAPGAGPARLPVICLHGLTRNARDFDALAPWIAARGRRVLAVDVRGRGFSDRDPQARYWLPTYVDDVVRMADALGIAAAVFVGTSMGGLIMMELAATAPSLVASAIVNDVGPALGARGLARIASYVGKPVSITTWDDAAAYLHDQNVAALPHYGAAEWAAMARRMFRETDGQVMADYDPMIAAAFATAPTPADPHQRWDALASGRPVLLLRGALSDLLDEEVAAAMIAGRPNVRFQQVPGVGHAPMLDEPAALDAIGHFLDEMD